MPWSMADIRVWSILPELIVCATGLWVLTLGFVSKRELGHIQAYFTLGGLVAAFLSIVCLWGKEVPGFSRMVALDAYGLFFQGVILLAALVTVLISMDYMKQGRRAVTQHVEGFDEGKTCIDCHAGIAHSLPAMYEIDPTAAMETLN